MEPMAAFRLNEIFKGWASNQRMDRLETTISVKTHSGARIDVYPTSPAEAAQYLRHFLNTNDNLFKPGVIKAVSPTMSAERPESIIFRSSGRVYDASGKVDYRRVLLHVAFTGEDKHSASSFSEHFGDDATTPQGYLTGPKIQHFINTLSSAGNDWKKIHFTTHTNQTPLQRIK